MSRKKSTFAVLVAAFLLCSLNPAPLLANSTASAPSDGGNFPDQADDGDFALQADPDRYRMFFPIMFASSSQAPRCDHMIDPGISVANTRTCFSDVRPGDTVCIAAGHRGDLSLRSFKGTPDKPIVFVNYGGQVIIDSKRHHGIHVIDSQFFRLTGTGTVGTDYGIKIVGSTGVGVRIGFKSSDFEIDHVEVTGMGGAGISAKTESVCSDGSTNNYDYDGDGIIEGDLDDVVNRDNFTQVNSVFHHNYIHRVGSEGFYVGNCYLGRDVSCGHGTETIYDPLLQGVSIYDNIVTDTGWDAIQVASAIEDCEIHHNRILRDSQGAVEHQQGGVMNAQGSVCDIYNNLIRDGGGAGIYVHGHGGNRVYNNVIVNAGQNAALGNNGGDGIAIGTGSNPGNGVYVLHNTIVSPANFGVGFFNRKGHDNTIQNNIVVDPGNYAIYGKSAYVQTWGRTNVLATNNLTTRTVADVKFKDPTSGDFSIQPDSPAVDYGIDPSVEVVATDFFGISRPQGLGYDVGAYELEFPPRP